MQEKKLIEASHVYQMFIHMIRVFLCKILKYSFHISDVDCFLKNVLNIIVSLKKKMNVKGIHVLVF